MGRTIKESEYVLTTQIYTHVTNVQLNDVEAVKGYSLVIGMMQSDASARFGRTSAEFPF